VVIRTRLVELSCLEAVAYRQKLRGGQAGVVILRHDSAQPGLALLNHRSGEADLAARQQLIQEEMVRAEAQLEIIKEILLRETGL
jgi:hypothetical protein